MSARILMFDSGIGGISVFREIKKLLPQVNIDYLFDNAFYPYGQLEETTLVDRITSLIVDVVTQEAPSLVVVACNTASTAALPALRRHLNIPVVGVVPAIKPAASASRSNAIGLLATEGTINRSYIDSLIEDHAANCHVTKVGSNELVEMAEMVYRGCTPDTEKLAKICCPFSDSVDTVVLGCTHFPLLSEYIIEVTNNNVMLVDSGKAIASRVARLLEEITEKTPEPVIDRAFYTKSNLDKPLLSALKAEGFELIEIWNGNYSAA